MSSTSAAAHRLSFGRAAGRVARWLVLPMLCLWATGCASLPSQVHRPPSSAFDAPDTTALGRLAQSRRAQAGTRHLSGFGLLSNADAAFGSRLALVQSAQRSLDLQYYAVHADASTEVLLQAVRDAARRGVRVRILLDDFNTSGDNAQVLRLAFVPGVELRLFNPLPASRGSMVMRILGSLHDLPRIQKRMHNKLFIADNAWGITGGRNLGDAYFGAGDDSNFIDLDVLAAGRIVRDMSASFDRYWNDQLAYPVQALLSPDDLDRLRGADAPAGPPEGLVPAALPTPAASGSPVLPQAATAHAPLPPRAPMDLQRVPLTWAPALLLVDEPGKIGPGDDEVNAEETVVDGLLGLMQQARQEVLIVSPYFVPGASMMQVFAQLRARQVRVRVLTNSLASNDAPLAHAGYRRYREDLLRLGVELHEMHASTPTAGRGRDRGGSGLAFGSAAGGSKAGVSRASLHSKAVVIDRRWSVIGSMNLDLRSQLKNSEVALLVRSPALAADATRLIDGTLRRGAYRVELDEHGALRWRAPPGAPFPDATREPDASLRLRWLVNLLGPFAPDEML